jgi:histone-lysine N-methyltransferase SETMAR
MDHVEQRIVLKFLFLKGLRYRAAHTELSSVLGEQAYSLSQSKRWIHRFKDGDLSCEDEDRSGRPLSDLSDGIRRHLDKYPFTSAQLLAKHFSSSVPTISRILKTHLGLRKFSRRWVPHDLTDDQKRSRCAISEGLLNALKNDECAGFSHVTTGDESWFSYRYQSTHCYAKSRVDVPPRTKTTIGTKKAMVTIFFTATKLLVLDVLPRGNKFNQDYFLTIIAPELSRENTNSKRRVGNKPLLVHMDNSMCHNARKIEEYFTRKSVTRVPHPAYSPDLSPSDFWFFGYAKEQMKDQVVEDEDDLEDKLTEVWEHVTEDVLQSVFYEWIARLEWVIAHGGEYYLNPH